ncbi:MULTISPECIES: sigma-54 dependent transcriptional regulator [unclassified Bdellovibrio]|jgi:two-component system nitrogen regulation response regulator NtrX|uniref:sigma-54-dependent transcriptional regulator n=1 Tax=unclassified Bdellovibrio TaxID=2633795 RepID=UPI00115A8C04|nr:MULTISPECIES: sigma-54 dependent transcriptional regulator [unclassified Bdellovibrio]QDK44351.1 sigma-54-dependent Fis family transcriptional regulator [Bdellovibrio sp. ZAP7]QLY26178.1 sigma-54-dependent Fis family transcriptional regulator [Bdellovibrio sp. KM01]
MTALSTKILIIDDEAPIRDVLSASLKDEGYQVFLAHDGESGLQAIKDVQPDVVFQDIWMPGKFDGIEVLTRARKEFPNVEFVMISGHGTIETAVKATKLGAWDFIEKPLSMDKILIVISNILSFQQAKEEKSLLLNKLRKSIALVGEAPSIVATKQVIARVAPTNSWVLIQGEAGTGKELVAQNIHYLSARASRPFVEINCGGIPEDLLESEIFGIEKGAMPGVDRAKKGKLDLAQGGTLYIAEISEMNKDAQAKLLTYLDDKKYRRVGGSETIENDVRVIAASSKDLDKEVKEGRFREDLYYRLNVIPFRVPALREHPEDIPVLVSFFSDNVARESGFPKKAISEQAMNKMLSHQWTGNVRELKNFIERVYILTPGEFVDVHDLRFAGLIDKDDEKGFEMQDLSTFRDARAQFEKEYLLRKINENGGNISKTAEVIGLERSYLHRKIKAYGIDTKDI